MLISHNPKFIFIHVPKTAGTSISVSIQRSHPCPHPIMALSRYHKSPPIGPHAIRHHGEYYRVYELNPDIWKRYFSFAFVRNPWERVISFFGAHNPTNGPLTQDHLQNLLNHPALCFQQYQYLYDREGAYPLVNFIGRYENLAEDFQTICSKLDLKVTLEQLNQSTHYHYRDYFNKNMQHMVAEKYAKDISLFNYEF